MPKKPAKKPVAAILAERGKTYGDFTDNARIAQELKDVMKDSPKWDSLDPVKKEGLEVIASKISRALTGDPEYADNYDDIAGYAKLISDRCQ